MAMMIENTEKLQDLQVSSCENRDRELIPAMLDKHKSFDLVKRFWLWIPAFATMTEGAGKTSIFELYMQTTAPSRSLQQK